MTNQPFDVCLCVTNLIFYMGDFVNQQPTNIAGLLLWNTDDQTIFCCRLLLIFNILYVCLHAYTLHTTQAIFN